MKRSRVVAVLVAAALGLCIWAGATAQELSRRRVITNGFVAQPAAHAAARSTTQTNSAADFNGKLVALYVRGGNQLRLLEKTRFEEIQGRRFLVGQEVKATFSFPLGRPAHIAWDAVEAFYIFDSAAQYEEATRQALEQAQGTVGQVLGSFFPGGNVTVNGPSFTSAATTDGSSVIPAERPTPANPTAEPSEVTSPNETQDARSPVLAEQPAPKRIRSRPNVGPR